MSDPKRDELPKLDAVAQAAVDRFLAAPVVRQEARRAVRATTPKKPRAKPAEALQPPVEDVPDNFAGAVFNTLRRSTNVCRWGEDQEPCHAMSWQQGLCKKHYTKILARKRAQAKKARRF
jgi:hypothetical protein